MHVRAFERYIPLSKILFSFQVRTSLDLITTKTDLVLIPQKATFVKVSKGAKIRNRYNQVPHLTQDTNGNVTNS